MDTETTSMDLVIDCTWQCSSPRTEPLAEDQRHEELSSGRVKLMCSYGGRILPRPRDHQLRYVGGETRLLGISRNILFTDLLSKLAKLCGTSVVPKYQLPNEDLDVLVSISNDEELDIMMEEFERQNSKDIGYNSRIRIFLFTPKQKNFVASVEDQRNPEQRFLDAVNGVSSVFQQHTKSFPSAQVPDFLFGLEALTKQDKNSAALSPKSFAAQYTFPAVLSSGSDKEFAFSLHSIACPQCAASLPRQETSLDKEHMLHATSVTEKRVISDSFIPTQPESSLRNDNQSGAHTANRQDHHSSRNARPNCLDPNSVDRIDQDTHSASIVQFNAGLIVEQQHKGMKITQGIIGHSNLDMSSSDCWNCENQGMIMQRIASDPNLSSDNRRQKLPSLKVSSNTTSGTRYWRADDDQQHCYDSSESLPRNLVLLPKPSSTQLPPPSMHRVASAPNVMKAAGDTLPPRCNIAPPHASQSLSRTYDQQLPTPQLFRTTPRSSRATHPSASRFRDLPIPEFQEQPTSSRHQNANHDPSVDSTSHILYDPTFSEVQYSEMPPKLHKHPGARAIQLFPHEQGPSPPSEVRTGRC